MDRLHSVVLAASLCCLAPATLQLLAPGNSWSLQAITLKIGLGFEAKDSDGTWLIFSAKSLASQVFPGFACVSLTLMALSANIVERFAVGTIAGQSS